MFASSLSYTSVRDFAYPVTDPLHYGPPPIAPKEQDDEDEEEDMDHMNPYDFPPPSSGAHTWGSDSWATDYYARAGDIPPRNVQDGPPWSEDEDLKSPIVSSRQRKKGSGSRKFAANQTRDRFYTASDSDTKLYYDTRDGKFGQFSSHGAPVAQPFYEEGRHRGNHPFGYRGDEDDDEDEGEEDDEDDGMDEFDVEGMQNRRYSRDYQFTITSPDEEMHGRAVALYDFEREDENELPLVEGQIVLISYRHGEGWLVAQDPKTSESGLVPEEYVRLLRDIEGGMNGLASALAEPSSPQQASPRSSSANFDDKVEVPVTGPDGATNVVTAPTPQYSSTAPTITTSDPTSEVAAENAKREDAVAPPTHSGSPLPANSTTVSNGSSTATASNNNGYPQPVLSTFSTSSRDFEPYPTQQLGIHAGQNPPQVVHYGRCGSQPNNTHVRSQSQSQDRACSTARPSSSNDASDKPKKAE